MTHVAYDMWEHSGTLMFHDINKQDSIRTPRRQTMNKDKIRYACGILLSMY